MTNPASSPKSSPDASCGFPVKLAPRFVERVWGSRDLHPLYPSDGPAPPPSSAPIGEVWLTGDENKVLGGPHDGRTLSEIVRECGPALLGDAAPAHPSGRPVFPLLVKFLFTSAKLSVQLHPPDSAAAVSRSWGKTEMWHVLRSAPAAALAVGFKEQLRDTLSASPDAFREAVRSGAIESMLDWREARAGDTYYVPAGTVHAIGSGLTICEIQQNSDITCRLYDYNRPGTDGRPRQLHIEEGLRVLLWQTDGGLTRPAAYPEDPVSRDIAADGLATNNPAAHTCLAACPYFATERWHLDAPFTHSPAGHLEIWIGLDGSAEFSAAGETVTCTAGEVVLLPAGIASVAIQSAGAAATFLRTYPPNLETDVLAPLRAAGVSQEDISRVCFSAPPSEG